MVGWRGFYRNRRMKIGQGELGAADMHHAVAFPGNFGRPR
jgi:hypothetical protein